MIPGLIPRVDGRVRVLGAGKAAASMAAAIESSPPKWLVTGQIDGLVVTPPGHGLPLSLFASMTAGHPVPNEASLDAGEHMLALAEDLREEDLLVALVSGGASALLAAPIEGATLQDESDLNRRLLRSGVPISQMKAARARLSSCGPRATRPRVSQLPCAAIAADPHRLALPPEQQPHL
jgi:hydroxypyruvate reductase